MLIAYHNCELWTRSPGTDFSSKISLINNFFVQNKLALKGFSTKSVFDEKYRYRSLSTFVGYLGDFGVHKIVS